MRHFKAKQHAEMFTKRFECFGKICNLNYESSEWDYYPTADSADFSAAETKEKVITFNKMSFWIYNPFKPVTRIVVGTERIAIETFNLQTQLWVTIHEIQHVDFNPYIVADSSPLGMYVDQLESDYRMLQQVAITM